MQQARRALLILISVVAIAVGFMPAAFAGPGTAATSPNAAPATAARGLASVGSTPTAAASQSLGYWLVASDGGIFSGGDAVFHGSTGALHLVRPIVGMAPTASGDGYWSVASDGGIFAFGDAVFHGSTGAMHLNRPIVGMAPTPSGHGYWLVASDGGIFAFGDAVFHGSTGAMHLNRPIVGITSTPSGHGYWLVASDGGIFAFGDAAFHGSTGAMHLNRPIVGIASSTTGHGYRMVASDGGIFSFGDARFEGSTGGIVLNQPIVGMAATASGKGYWFVAKDGGVFSFGDAGFFGSAGAMSLNSSIVGMVATAPVAVATQLEFATQPGDATGGLPFAAQPSVKVEDSSGAVATHDTSTVTLTLTAPDGATLHCTANPRATVAGVATFSGCNIDHTGTYTLTASDGTLTHAVSTTITITAGIGARLAFSAQPSGAVIATSFGTQPVVSVLDAGGNVAVGDTSTVALTITAPTGGAVLGCIANSKAAITGVATFAGCDISVTAGNYTLTASDAGFVSVASASLQITLAASQLAFTTEPSGAATSTVPFASQPVVKIQDSAGRTIIAATNPITLAITAPANGAAVVCTNNTVTPVAGVATFAGCHINLASAHTVTATGAGFTTVSSPIAVVAGAASQLVFSTPPSGTANGGTNFAAQPVVTVEDATGNTVTTPVTVTLAVTAPAAGAAVVCTNNAVAAASGIATFAGCRIDLASTHTLTASIPGPITVASGNVIVSVGPPSHIVFTTQPSATALAGAVFAAQPAVTVEDAGGNTVSAVTTVTLAVTAPANGAAVVCTNNALATVQGVATFAGCHIDLESSNSLTASITGPFTVVSTVVAISPASANQLVFTTPPSGTATAGTNLVAQPIVTVEDAFGNTVTTANTVTLAVTAPANGATVVCTNNAVVASAGVATFAGCHMNTASTHTLTASIPGPVTVVSGNVVVSPAAASQLVFTTPPSATATGGTNLATQPIVTVEDAFGNTVTTANTVTLAVSTPANGAAVVCTNNAVVASLGVATFAGCHINLAPSSHTLTASIPGPITVNSAAVTVAVGAPSQVGFATSPSASTGGVAFPTQPIVTVQDAGGNTVTTDSSAVVLTLTTVPSGATLVCTTSNSRNAVNGVATFDGCTINVAANYTLTATDGALPTVASSTFAITVGAPFALVFLVQPVGALHGDPLSTQPTVRVVDRGGNTVTAAPQRDINLTIAAGGTGTLSCTTNPLTTIAGVATFSGCSISAAGTDTITATGGGFTVNSDPVIIT